MPAVDFPKLLFGLLGLSPLLAASQHAHGASCACARHHAAHRFDLDCAAGATLTAATATLSSCAVTRDACSEVVDGVQKCQAAFFTLQAHHDHCEHGLIAEEHDHLIHQYESVCDSCEIQRAFDPAVSSNCPVVDCRDTGPAILAFHALSFSCTAPNATHAGSCCGKADERAAFEILMSFHDQCAGRSRPHDHWAAAQPRLLALHVATANRELTRSQV